MKKASPIRRGFLLPLLSLRAKRPAGIGTFTPDLQEQVAGFHRASPSTTLDKSCSAFILLLQACDILYRFPRRLSRKKNYQVVDRPEFRSQYFERVKQVLQRVGIPGRPATSRKQPLQTSASPFPLYSRGYSPRVQILRSYRRLQYFYKCFKCRRAGVELRHRFSLQIRVEVRVLSKCLQAV
ncbi:hypothetical protein TAMC210_18180 [Thermanaeromonas sp. C210]|nr:hypothetical protein TAMC210_18180 [Thermanaeromonas sp. C210]